VHPSLRSRIRNGTLLVLVPVLLVSLFALPRTWELGGAIRAILQENYISIQVAQHLQLALHNLQVAELEGNARTALPGLRDEFNHWLNIELQTLTEIGEPETAHEIDTSAKVLFGEIESSPPGTRHDAEFDHLMARINFLIKLNENAMWRNDNRARELGKRLVYTLGISLTVALLLSIGFSWFIGQTIARPLTEVASQLRGVGERKNVRLGAQELSELQDIAKAFNDMVDRLDYYDRLNVDRLLFEKTKIEAIIQRLEDGVVLIDAQGKIAHMNEVAGTVLGISAGAATDRSFDDLPSKAPSYLRIREELQKVVKDERAPREIEADLFLGGRDHTFLLRPMRLTEGKYAFGTLLILQDITYIRDQDRARTNLVATLAHELRTPLTSLGLAAQLLENEGPVSGHEQRQLVKTIVTEFSRLSELIDELLDLSRGRVPSMDMRRIRFNLTRIVEDFAGRFLIQAEQKQIKMNLHVGALPEIYGDPVKISWVLSNLITNALRYTHQGGVVEVTARQASSEAIRLEVKDTGPGIAPEIREHIFERFAQYTVDGHPPGSAGLGLAIAKDIVNAHGGRIFVESEVGHGSRFVVELPVHTESLTAH
jgi:two-component system, NtrC family, sensor histidine kinase KinB